jgi:multiple sugar transport system permease protein
MEQTLTQAPAETSPQAGLLAGRRARHLREAVTGYAMIAPAVILIFLFGIFPVAFALYVSLHQWVIVRRGFIGVENYLDAIGNFTYLMLFGLGVGAVVWGWRAVRRLRPDLSARPRAAWLLALPALAHAAAVIAFFRWAFYQLPEFLEIANRMRGLDRTRELFFRLLSDAFRAETVYPYWQQFTGIFLAALAAGVAAALLVRTADNPALQARFAAAWLALAGGAGLLWAAWRAVQGAYAAAVESGLDPGIWPQLIAVVSGGLLLVLAWRLWRSAPAQASSGAFVLRLLAALALMVGAVLLIIEIPTIVAAGDEDMWNGLKVTVFFSLGTIPIQLAIGLVLAVLLFQQLAGSGLFRVLFFLPYVTPAVASATVFRLMFSERQSGPANTVLSWFGLERQLWLREPKGILTMLAERVGIADFPAAVLPGWLPPEFASLLTNWLAGPSLALVVILMLSIWTFVGYNAVIYLAGLGNISREISESAEIDGAGRWDVFRYITFPLLSPTTYFLSLVGVMGTFKSFNTIWVMRTGQALGTTDTFSIVIFQEFFEKSRYGYASALAFVLFGIILVLTFFNTRIQGSRVFYG